QLTFRVATSRAPSRPQTPRAGVPTTPPPAAPKTTAFRQIRPAPRTATPRRAAGSSGLITIGRAKSNAIVVDDALTSRVHAVLVSESAGLEIRDNNSSNGTFVNGKRITKAVLRDGDVVTIGNTDLLATGNTLVPQPAAARTSGLIAHGLGLTVEGRQL